MPTTGQVACSWSGGKDSCLAYYKAVRQGLWVSHLICGESGEYHTFVLNGPGFGHRTEVRETNRVLRNEHWFLDILSYQLVST